MGNEKVKRSIAKTITWRIFGTLVTTFLMYLYVGSLDVSFLLGGIDLLIKTFLYFFHERLWEKVDWGKG